MKNQWNPLPLPRFTFLFRGPDPSSLEPRHALANAIATLDNTMLLQDLEEPLRNATHGLYWGGYNPDVDLTNPTIRSDFRLLGYPFSDWIWDLEKLVRERLGPEALGALAVRDYIEQNHEAFFGRVLYRDAHSQLDLEPFMKRFGSEEVCAIHLGLAPGFNLGCRHIWLPVPETEKQIEFLQHELQPKRAPGSAEAREPAWR